MATSTVNTSTKSSSWFSWVPSFGSSSSNSANAVPEKKTSAQEKLDTVKAECEKKIEEATIELDNEQKVLGGRRRRKSAKKSNKKRKTAKKSLYTITKKWNPFAK